MLNRLIDDIQPATKKLNIENYSISEYAKSFLDGLNPTQKQRFKKMLENNYDVGMSVAKTYGINYRDFIKEIKRQLNIK